jgi:hypothetical protein
MIATHLIRSLAILDIASSQTRIVGRSLYQKQGDNHGISVIFDFTGLAQAPSTGERHTSPPVLKFNHGQDSILGFGKSGERSPPTMAYAHETWGQQIQILSGCCRRTCTITRGNSIGCGINDAGGAQ